MKGSVKKYLLYVGNFYPHKNLKKMILAFEKIIKETNLDYCLILVGGSVYGRKNRIIITGYVDDHELNNLYRGADLYIFPSLYEGFGLPALEAMKRNVAVVSSNTSCLPEVLGNAALYFDPSSVEDMAEKIKRVLLNKDIKNNLIKKGLERLKNYDWQRTAEETLKIYESN